MNVQAGDKWCFIIAEKLEYRFPERSILLKNTRKNRWFTCSTNTKSGEPNLYVHFCNRKWNQIWCIHEIISSPGALCSNSHYCQKNENRSWWKPNTTTAGADNNKDQSYFASPSSGTNWGKNHYFQFILTKPSAVGCRNGFWVVTAERKIRKGFPRFIGKFVYRNSRNKKSQPAEGVIQIDKMIHL